MASSRRQKKQGRWPAAKAVASSRKNSSVQLRRAITSRRRPRNSSTQVSQADVDQRLFSRVLVAGSWMMPRLPTNIPRSGVAMMSPDGVTRFCRGMLFLLLPVLHGEKVGMRGSIRKIGAEEYAE